jgi:hypothetical protein
MPGDGSGSPGRPHQAIIAVLRGVRLFGFAGWAYLATNTITHPDSATRQLTHFATWPNEDTAAAVCIVLSAATFFVLALIDPPPGRGHRDRSRR